MSAHRKPTHRTKVLAAALGTGIACSGVAFAVQGPEEPVASAPTPLTTSSAPSPSSSTTPADQGERDPRPSRSATHKRDPLAGTKAGKAGDRPAPEEDPTPSEVVDPTSPVPTPTRKLRRQTTDDSPAPGQDTTRQGGILGGTNAARADAGLPALSTNTCLTDLAQRHAERLAASQSLRHQDLSTVMSVCDLSTAGENVAMNYTGPSAAVGQWMDSSGHRANILNGRFTLIGIGTAQARDGAWYAVQVFGAD